MCTGGRESIELRSIELHSLELHSSSEHQCSSSEHLNSSIKHHCSSNEHHSSSSDHHNSSSEHHNSSSEHHRSSSEQQSSVSKHNIVFLVNGKVVFIKSPWLQFNVAWNIASDEEGKLCPLSKLILLNTLVLMDSGVVFFICHTSSKKHLYVSTCQPWLDAYDHWYADMV